MVCLNCGAENPQQAKFCINCGQPLPRPCPNCGALNPPNARFCNQCGAPLTTAAATPAPAMSAAMLSSSRLPMPREAPPTISRTRAGRTAYAGAATPTVPTVQSAETAAIAEEMAEQRRVVTILFADLTNSTTLGETTDPEELRATLAQFFALMAREIHRHGGTVEKYIGDAVMAVFGLPIAHEDDPVRAVRAALGMQAALRDFNGERLANDPSAAELQLRIGVNTGEVAAAGDAQEGRDFLITGDAVNVAARLQQLAEPGAVLVGPRAYRGTRGAVRYRALAPVTLRGKARPAIVFEALALLDADGAPTPRPRGLDGLRSPMVGREVEMDLLGVLSQRVMREWRPHFVTILGAPGVGKTRLAREFILRLLGVSSFGDLDLMELGCEAEDETETQTEIEHDTEAQAGHTGTERATGEGRERRHNDATNANDHAGDHTGDHDNNHTAGADNTPPRPLLLEGRCPPYGEDVTYWPLAEMLRVYCGFGALDSPRRARSRLLAAVRRRFAAVGRSEDPELVAAYLGHTIGIESAQRRAALLPGDNQQLQEGRLRAWRIFFEALAAGRGLVALVDDMHWADDALLDLLTDVAARASNVPLLLLATARPDLLERRPTWGGGKRNYATIALEALSTSDTARLVRQLLPGEGVPERLRASILDKADGNPFYVEEIIRMLVDRGVLARDEEATGGRNAGWRVAPDWEQSEEVRDPVIPDTVQGVLAARLDLLTPGERDVLQHAAVIGRYFWPTALLHLAQHLQPAPLERTLRALGDKDLIRVSERAGMSIAPPAEEVYTFNHGLTREVVYGAIPRTRRAHEHLRVAEWLEQLSQAQPGESAFTELLAQHYYRYYTQANLARSRNRERRLAVRATVTRYLAQAGEQSITRHAFTKADGYFTDALDLLHEGFLPEESPLVVEARVRRGNVRWLALRADEAWNDYREALRIWSAYSEAAPVVTEDNQPVVAPVARTTDGATDGLGGGTTEAALVEQRAQQSPQTSATSEPQASQQVRSKAAESPEPAVTALPLNWRERGMRIYRLLAQTPTRNPGLFKKLPPYEELRSYLDEGLRLAEALGQRDTLDYAALLTAKSFFWWSWAEERSESDLLDAYRSAHEAVRITEALGDPHGASEALDALGNIQAITTDLRGYLESQTRRIAWGHRIDDVNELVDIYTEVSQAHMMVGEYEQSIQAANTALELANSADLDGLRLSALWRMTLTYTEWDRWTDAVRTGEQIQALSTRAVIRQSRHHLWALLALATVQARMGDMDASERLARQVAEAPPFYPAQYIEVARARLSLARGATDEAKQTLLAAVGARSGRHSMAALLGELVELAARTGDIELYDRYQAQALEIGWRSGARKALAQAIRARAIIGMAAGRWDDALADAQNALGRYRALGSAWEEARTRYALAGLYRRRAASCDDALALDELTTALRLFDELHAVRDIARTRAALAGGDVRLP
ncbi:MAG: adenylate/guanylate cyclase domain-containing protein [Ktedonobacterales bacterium]